MSTTDDLRYLLSDTAARTAAEFWRQVENLPREPGWEIKMLSGEDVAWMGPPGEFPRPTDRPFVRIRHTESGPGVIVETVCE